MHGLREIKKMNEPKQGLQANENCKAVNQVIARYTEGCEKWMEATNGIPDATCLAISVEDMQLLIKRIAELEAAQQWYPASEPPEDDRHVLVEICFPDVDVSIVDIGKHGQYCDVLGDIRWQHHYMMTNGIVTRWRDLPPIQEKESQQ